MSALNSLGEESSIYKPSKIIYHLLAIKVFKWLLRRTNIC